MTQTQALRDLASLARVAHKQTKIEPELHSIYARSFAVQCAALESLLSALIGFDALSNLANAGRVVKGTFVVRGQRVCLWRVDSLAFGLSKEMGLALVPPESADVPLVEVASLHDIGRVLYSRAKYEWS